MKRGIITADRVFGAACIIIGILCIKECIRMYGFASSFLSGDHIVMGIVGGVLVLLGVILGIKNKRLGFTVEFPEPELAKRMAGTVLVLILYVLSLDKLGFVVSTAVWGIFWFRLFGMYSYIRCIIYSAITTAALWLVFIYGLGMSFPRGILG